ncbi:MAG: peptide deformylase [Bacteroidales bacterium]|nr:peptide deformylase [Bacteroidales bacterium]
MNKVLTFILCMGFVAAQAQRFGQHERDMIESGKSSDRMRITQITDKSDSLLLRSKARKVRKIKDPIISKLSERMLQTVLDPANKGVGIAAPQVGIGYQVILVQRFDKEGEPFETVINPEIRSSSDSLWRRIEGCLSIPVIRDTVERPWSIEVRYRDIHGKKRKETVNGFTARIFQHEIDHLNGVLFIDYIYERK